MAAALRLTDKKSNLPEGQAKKWGQKNSNLNLFAPIFFAIPLSAKPALDC